ncbi:MAG: hypothetical protein H7203_08090 [Rhizobacter sp.]|nr:hypothetical protein [Burkholderiales bacterium]
MRSILIMTVALTLGLTATLVSAQTAIRCDVDGKVVYGDTACAPGNAARAIAPTRETAEQKAAGKAANDQMRKDTAAVDKRMDDRFKRDTTRPVVMSASTKDEKSDARSEPKRKGVKAKKSKTISKKVAAKAPKKDNRSYRSAPKT